VDKPEEAVKIIVDFRKAKGQVGIDLPSEMRKPKS
jgi:hypothetical protein